MSSKNLRKSRTNTDWSKHELIINKTEDVSTYILKIPYTTNMYVNFTNTQGCLIVTGDLGNLIFNREFFPSPDGYVSDHYWVEKLESSSEQKAEEYDAEKTKKTLLERYEEYKEEYELTFNGFWGDYSYDKQKEMNLEVEQQEYLEWLDNCIDDVYNEFGYTSYAYGNIPDGYDYEDVVFCTTIKYSILTVFDAFEEICSRMTEVNKKEEELKSIKEQDDQNMLLAMTSCN